VPDGGLAQLTDELVGQVAQVVRPAFVKDENGGSVISGAAVTAHANLPGCGTMVRDV
jgi:hypothetical protein